MSLPSLSEVLIGCLLLCGCSSASDKVLNACKNDLEAITEKISIIESNLPYECKNSVILASFEDIQKEIESVKTQIDVAKATCKLEKRDLEGGILKRNILIFFLLALIGIFLYNKTRKV